MLFPLKFQPGLVRDSTHYSNGSGWWDSHWVRFRMGLPEKMGGWQKNITTAFLGTCRQLLNWTILSGLQYFGLGTHLKYYVSSGGTFTDVTPLRTTTALGADPFAVTSGSTICTVTDAANGSVMGDFVTFSGATGGFAGLSAGDLNKEFQIVTIVNANSYTITLSATPNATTTGGGAGVAGAYQIHVGLDTSVMGLGWGAGTWGRGTWGSAATTGPTIYLRLWSADTFGEDLVANVRDGGIYYWDATFPTNRMVALSALAGASDTPTIATQVMVSAQERHIVAFGCDPLSAIGTQDPLFIRWSDAESNIQWTPTATNSAGGYRLSVGTRIVSALETRSQTLIWTDQALYTMTWTGPPYTFSFAQVGSGTNIIAPNGAVTVNDVCFWMGREQFYAYDGRLSPLPCPISDYIFRRLNLNQAQKIFAFTNSIFDEVGWLYPSTSGSECDSYVIFNYKEKAWYFGSLSRTAWLDRGPSYYPNATSADSYFYDHEFGFDDGSTNPPVAINAFIESSPMEGPDDGPGDHFLFISRLIPDVTFRDSTADAPSVAMTVKMQNYPGSSFSQSNASTITQTSTVTIEQFTEQAFIRLRGRSAVFRCESSDLGVTWRLGTPRLEFRMDGRR